MSEPSSEGRADLIARNNGLCDESPAPPANFSRFILRFFDMSGWDWTTERRGVPGGVFVRGFRSSVHHITCRIALCLVPHGG